MASRRRCRECGRVYGRRTNRAGRRGFCGSTCADEHDATEVRAGFRRSLRNQQLLDKAAMTIEDVTSSKGVLTPLQAQKFREFLKAPWASKIRFSRKARRR